MYAARGSTSLGIIREPNAEVRVHTALSFVEFWNRKYMDGILALVGPQLFSSALLLA
jgi:hypothetical protein